MNGITRKNPRRTLSDKESNILSELSYHNKSIFTTEDIKKLEKNPKSILENLVKKKWILKIRRGVYLIIPLEAGKEGADNYTIHSFVIGSLLSESYYIGYWSALNYYGFTEQTPPRVYVATTKQKDNTRILDTEFRFVRIAPYKLFDIDVIKIENRDVNISSPEKTFVDCLDRPRHAGGIEEGAKALYFSHDELDLRKLAKLAIQIQNTAVIKRLGYLSELYKLEECLQALSTAPVSQEYSSLEPFSKKKGKIVERWQLRVNAEVDPKRWM